MSQLRLFFPRITLTFTQIPSKRGCKMFPPPLRNLHTSTIPGRVLPPMERNSLPSGGAVNPYRKTSVFYKLHPNYLGGGEVSFNKPCQMSRVRGKS